MALTFRDRAKRLSPPWLRKFYGERFVGVVWGLVGDTIIEALAQAARAANLRSGFQPPDALPSIGSERSMPRYPADTNTTYRERLAEAWETWRFGGNERAIQQQYTAFGLANVEVIPAINNDPRPERQAWAFENPPAAELVVSGAATVTFTAGATITVAGATSLIDLGFRVDQALVVQGSVSNDTVDEEVYQIEAVTSTTITVAGAPIANEGPLTNVTLLACNWSRFVVVVEQSHPWTTWTYGSGPVYSDGDDAPTYGSTATFGEVKTVKAIARKWKAAHTINPYIVVVLDHPYYGEPGLMYGGGAVYGGETIKWLHQS